MAEQLAEAGPQDIQDVLDSCRAKILHTLEVFPFVSASMLHMGIGTSTPTALWQPIMKRMVEEGAVARIEKTFKAPNGRMQPYTIYHLPTNVYRYGPKPE